MSAESQTKPRRSALRRLGIAFLIFLLILAVTLVFEHFYGHWKLEAVKREMEKRGQVTDIRKLLPAAPSNYQAFTNRFAKAVHSLGDSILLGGGNRIDVAPGKAARGSQAPFPVVHYSKVSFTNGHATFPSDGTNTWASLEQHYAARQDALVELRALLRDPPDAMGVDYFKDFPGSPIPNFVGFRRAAQILVDNVCLELHRENRQAAEENLIALSGFMRLYSKDPILVTQMIRAAIEDLGSSGLWNAMQADGWSEPQLERLQKAWQTPPLVSGIVDAMHFERVERLEYYNSFRQMSYQEWYDRANKIWTSFGAIPRPLPDIVQESREYIFHPVWKFAWAEEEMAAYLERSDFLTTLPQEALKHKAFGGAYKKWMWSKHDLHDPPLVPWRFYFSIPLVFEMAEMPARSLPQPISLFEHLKNTWLNTEFPFFNTTMAFKTAARNECSREMAVTSIALKRYALRHRRFPDQLNSLIPEFLSELPVDWMDGKPLRYSLNADGTYMLYSVGHDGRDDGGVPAQKDWQSSPGTDLVWPSVVPWAK